MAKPDLSGITDNYFTAAQKGFSDTLSSSISDSDDTIALNSVSGFDDEVWIFLWIEPGTSEAELVYGQIDTDTTSLINAVRGILGTAAVHSSGATVSSYVSSAHWMLLKKALDVEHSPDGTHSDVLLKRIYPVGSIYINASVATNPGTLLGFGTWAAFGAGQVPVGLDSGDTDFDTAGETGGAKTHTHPLSQAGWARVTNDIGGVETELVTGVTSWTPNRANDWGSQVAGSTSSQTVGAKLDGDTDSGSTVQPYIVVYMWKRTA